jgi:hypothetical protein
MRFNTILKLGPNREMTKEGFTLFRNVSVSRTGEQVYGPDEGTGIEPGPDGFIYITRTPEEVFRPETLESGNGKSLVILHPEEDVSPENWRALTHGVMFNMRRGTGEQRDESVCDLMVYTPEAVREIDLNMREVSLGYDADYYQTGPGRGEQRNYYINHVALVPAGRCGSSCAVRDHAHEEKNPMKSRLQRVLDALAGTKDDAELRRVLDKARDEEEEAEKTRERKERDEAEAKEKEIEAKDEEFKKEVRDSITKLTDAVGKLVKDKAKDEEEEEAKGKKKEEDEDEDEEEMEEETGSADAGKARDSALLEDSFNDIKAKAEIIAPGIQMPTFDAKADPKKTFRDCHCGLRRKALQQATQDAETAEIVKTVRGRALDSADILKMSCGQVRTIFNGVAAMKANRNNGRLTVDAAQTQNKTQDNVSPMDKFKAASKARWSDKK